jgi:hypothetical protein
MTQEMKYHEMKYRLVQGQAVAVKPGKPTRLDRLKAYYKAISAAVGFGLVFLNELSPLATDLGIDRNWVNTGIAILTLASVVLKSNEHWATGEDWHQVQWQQLQARLKPNGN